MKSKNSSFATNLFVTVIVLFFLSSCSLFPSMIPPINSATGVAEKISNDDAILALCFPGNINGDLILNIENNNSGRSYKLNLNPDDLLTAGSESLALFRLSSGRYTVTYIQFKEDKRKNISGKTNEQKLILKKGGILSLGKINFTHQKINLHRSKFELESEEFDIQNHLAKSKDSTLMSFPVQTLKLDLRTR